MANDTEASDHKEPSDHKTTDEKDVHIIDRSGSVEDGNGEVVDENNALHRKLEGRHMQMIAIGVYNGYSA